MDHNIFMKRIESGINIFFGGYNIMICHAQTWLWIRLMIKAPSFYCLMIKLFLTPFILTFISSPSVFILTKRYGPLRGPTSSSSGGHQPLADAFFALLAKKELIMLFWPIFGNFWCPVVTLVTFSSNLGNFESNPKKPKKSRIRETSNLSTDADSSTDATLGWTKHTQKPKKNLKRKKSSRTEKLKNI